MALRTRLMLFIFMLLVCLPAQSADRGITYTLDIKAEDLRIKISERLSDLEKDPDTLADVRYGLTEIYLMLLSKHPDRNEQTFQLYMRALKFKKLEDQVFAALLTQFGTRYFRLMKNDGLTGPNTAIFEKKLADVKIGSDEEEKIKVVSSSLDAFAAATLWTIGILAFSCLGVAFGGKLVPVEHTIPRHWVGVGIVVLGIGYCLNCSRILDTLALHLASLSPIAFDSARDALNSNSSVANPFAETYGFGASTLTDSIAALAPGFVLASTLFVGIVLSASFVGRSKTVYTLLVAIFAALMHIVLVKKMRELTLLVCPGTFELKLQLLTFGPATAFAVALIGTVLWLRHSNMEKAEPILCEKEASNSHGGATDA